MRKGPTYRFVRRGSKLAWENWQGSISTDITSGKANKRRLSGDLAPAEGEVNEQLGHPGPQRVRRRRSCLG